MKAYKVILIILLVVLLAVGAAFGAILFMNRDKGPEPDEVSDSIVALCDEFSLKSVDAAEEGMKAYLKEKEKVEEEEREKEEKEKEEEEEEDDPANADSTEETGQNESSDSMIQRYIGTWEQQGILMGDGNLDQETDSYCTYVFRKDYSYTAKGKDMNGKKIDERGTWKLNAKKQIVAGGSTMGIDESGYLLKDTGERDGKGRRMRYAFSRS